MDVVAALVDAARRDVAATLPHRQVGRCKVGGAAEEFRNQRRERLDGVLRGLAGGDDFGLVDDGLEGLGRLGGVVGGQSAVHAAFEFSGEFREGSAVGGELFVPGGLRLGAGWAGVPRGAYVLRYFEGAVGDAQCGARGSDFILAERGAVNVVRTGLVRRTLADDGLAADQCRLVVLCLGRGDGAVDGVDVVAVNVADDVPAVGFKALRRVVGEPAVHVSVDGDAVIVVQRDQLGELPSAGQRTGFVRDAFHHAAVAEEGVGVVVDDGVPVAVEFGGEQLLGERHADRVADALPERAGGCFDARRVADFGVARRFAVQLAEFFQFIERQIVAGQVQQCVDEHRSVPVGEHKTVAVGPFRGGRVVFQVTIPQRHGDFRHAHRSARMPGVGCLYTVHGENADGVRQRSLRNHE